VPVCADVRRVARGAATLLAAPATSPFLTAPEPGRTLAFEAPSAGRYALWLSAPALERASVLVDGVSVGSVPRRRDTTGQYVPVGTALLDAGAHTLELRSRPGLLSPAARDAPAVSLVVAPIGSRRRLAVPASTPETLCGAPWDWVEGLGPAA
jgi:hypothetical protein